MTQSLKNSVAITGIGKFGMGSAPGWKPMELMQKAAVQAVADAGLKMSDIDGLAASTFVHFFPSLSAAEQLGIKPKWSNSDMVGGSSFMNYVTHAAAAIQAGLCNHVLVMYGSDSRSTRDLNGMIETPHFEAPFEPIVPMTGYTLAASRYMHEYGITREDLGQVHITARQWAAKNPEAELRDPITMEEILAARFIATPFTKFDCCLLSDGGAAIVISRADQAKDMKAKPVYLKGTGAAHWHREVAQMPDLTVTAATESADRAFEMAGVTRDDIDVVELYDAFTLNVPLLLEDMGFAKKGEGIELVRSGAIAPGGRLPTNTNGGGIACVHPGMYGLFCIIEAVEQLRGNTGERQVEGAKLAVAHGNGGTYSHQATLVLGNDAAL